MSAPETQFKVAITKIGGYNIGAGTKQTTYFKLNFDNFKSHDTVAKNSSDPVWEDNVSFTYSTKFIQRLSVKEIVVEVWSKHTFSADKLLGDGRIDLLTVFTGPKRVEIPIANKSHAEMGVVWLDVDVVQVANIQANVSNLVLELDDAGTASSVPVSVGLSLPAAMKASSTATAVGGGAFAAAAEIVTPAVTTFANELFLNAVVISSIGNNGSQLSAWLPVHQFYSYSDSVSFETDLLVSGTNTVVGTVRGRLKLLGLPEFIQMAQGKYAGSAGRVQAGEFFLEDVPRKPTCKIELDPRYSGMPFISRSTPPSGVVCPPPTNTRAGRGASGRSRAGSTAAANPAAAAAASAAVDSVASQLGSTLSFHGAGHGGAAGGAGASAGEDVSGAIADAQNAIGAASAVIYSANNACQQLERASDERAARAPAEEARLRDLRRAVNDASATVERLRASAANFQQKAQAASAAAKRWPSGSQEGAALSAEADRNSSFLVEVESLRGTADEVMRLRQAAVAAELELRAHESSQAEAEASVLSTLRSALVAMQGRLSLAQSMVGQASSGAASGSRLTEAAGGLRAALSDVQSAIETAQRVGISHASKAGTLVANRDRVVSSVEKATSALMAAEAEVNANADSAAAAAKASGIPALLNADPSASMSSRAPPLQSPGGRGGAHPPLSPQPSVSSSPSATRLPACWSRHVVPGDNRVYFQNEVNRSTTWSLPTQGQYDVTWPSPTSLGIRLEELDIPGAPPAPYGYPPLKACNLLESSGAAGNGAINADLMAMGHTLLSANGVLLYGKQLSEVLAVITSMPRPLTLRFNDPFAVSPEVAARAADLRFTIEQTPMPSLFPPLHQHQHQQQPQALSPQPMAAAPGPYGYPSMPSIMPPQQSPNPYGGYPPSMPVPGPYGGYAPQNPYGGY